MPTAQVTPIRPDSIRWIELEPLFPGLYPLLGILTEAIDRSIPLPVIVSFLFAVELRMTK